MKADMDNLKDHQIAEVVNTLRDIAVEFHSAQQLRERIAHVIVPLLSHRAVPQANAEQDALKLKLHKVNSAAHKLAAKLTMLAPAKTLRGKDLIWREDAMDLVVNWRREWDLAVAASKTTPSSGEGSNADQA